MIYIFANFIIQLSLYLLTCHSGTDKALFPHHNTHFANLYVQKARTARDATLRDVSCLPRDTAWHKILHNLLHKRAEENIIRYYYFLFGWVATERDPSKKFAPSLPENGALRVFVWWKIHVISLSYYFTGGNGVLVKSGSPRKQTKLLKRWEYEMNANLIEMLLQSLKLKLSFEIPLKYPTFSCLQWHILGVEGQHPLPPT